MEKIMSSWWPCSLPPPPLWLHLNYISNQIYLLPDTDQLICLQPQETIVLVFFFPHPSSPLGLADVQNYRPVSLLSFLFKTLEHAVYNQLASYLFQNDLLLTQISQASGLLTPLWRPSSWWLIFFTPTTRSLIPFFNHQILLSTLAELGIADSTLTWFTSYLTNRTFPVLWNDSLSKPAVCLQSANWCPSRLSIRTTSVFTIHWITRLCNHILTTLNCSSFPHQPSPTPMHFWMSGRHLCLGNCVSLQHSTSVKLISSSSRGKTVLAWTCQSLSRMSQNGFLSTARTLGVILDDGLSCPPTSLLWHNPADLPSTTSAGSGPSWQRMQRNSWAKCWSSPA